MNNNDGGNSLDQELSGFEGDDQSLESMFSADESGPADAAEDAVERRPARDIAMFSKIPVRLSLEVDSVEVMLGELLELNPGEVLPLDKKIGESLDVKVNGQLLAKAEVVVVDGRYGLRLLDIVDNIKVSGQD